MPATTGPGQTTTIAQTRAFYEALARSCDSDVDQIELALAHLVALELDDQTLSNLQSAQEDAQLAAARCRSTVVTLDARQRLMEEAVNATPEAARTEFYREGAGPARAHDTRAAAPATQLEEPVKDDASNDRSAAHGGTAVGCMHLDQLGPGRYEWCSDPEVDARSEPATPRCSAHLTPDTTGPLVSTSPAAQRLDAAQAAIDAHQASGCPTCAANLACATLWPLLDERSRARETLHRYPPAADEDAERGDDAMARGVADGRGSHLSGQPYDAGLFTDPELGPTYRAGLSQGRAQAIDDELRASAASGRPSPVGEPSWE